MSSDHRDALPMGAATPRHAVLGVEQPIIPRTGDELHNHPHQLVLVGGPPDRVTMEGPRRGFPT
jgi:hypothetical protein